MKLKTLLSVLMVYYSNFKVLHWMAEGEAFFTLHEKADEYADMLLADMDNVGEICLRANEGVVNYIEALRMIEEDENYEFLLINSGETYDVEKFKNNAIKMFNDILTCIKEALNEGIENIGIKSTLEGMYDKYDLQANYLLKRFNDKK